VNDEHVMVDLETMGNKADAAIIAVSAVRFSTEHGTLSRFYRVVGLESSLRCGGRVDASTIVWWMQQSNEARSAITEGERLDLAVVLQEFTAWMPEETTSVWGNGAAFDNVILRGAYERLGLQPPWPFWADRCYRTLKVLHPEVPFVRQGTHHHALHDAESQALHLIQILKRAA
jgi:exodeoxyribonuclease VIII